MFVVRYKKIFFIIAGILLLVSVFFVFYDGLNLSIDFTGGSVLEVTYTGTEPQMAQVKKGVDSVVGDTATIQPIGDNGYNIKTPFLSEIERQTILSNLSFNNTYTVTQKKFSSVGPVIGRSLKTKALGALLLAMLAIILFVAFAFRGVSKPISSWVYGLVAIISLIHDMLIPIGLFALLGVFANAQIDILFVTALMAILGYSVNDTIIVFDRIRENLKNNQEKKVKEDFEITVGKSLSQTFARSINTSLTTALALLALYIVGGEAVHYFSLVLLVGVIAGTYSSIFLASPLLVVINDWQTKRREK